jgi:hypothetical protein
VLDVGCVSTTSLITVVSFTTRGKYCSSKGECRKKGTVESAPKRGGRATAPLEDICHRAFPALFCPTRYIMAVRDVAHVERSGADLHRGGRHRGRAAAAGVSDCTNLYASRTSLPLRRDGHTKVYCGRSEEVMRPHARVMEKPTQIADCVTQQRRLLRPALCSDEHRTWQVYHAQSRFSLRWVPHADSG